MRSDPVKNQPPVPDIRYRRLLFNWLPLALYCTLIFWQSSLPTSKDPVFFHHEDKLLHMAACAVLAWLFVRALTTTLFYIKIRHRRFVN